MLKPFFRMAALAGWLGLLSWPGLAAADPSTPQARIAEVLANVAALQRPGQDGYATVWDGNKYVQCRLLPDHDLLCEAAGALMQPSLNAILTPERIARLGQLGWKRDPRFGNYVQTFATRAAASQVAEQIAKTLAEGYDADLTRLETQSDWIASEPCPPRNGPSQNLAGMINDAPAMAATAVHACAYTPDPEAAVANTALSSADLAVAYGPRVAAELQRLRINQGRDVFVVLDTDVGYIQCQPQSSPAAIYCEAESAQSWPVLASILTPERLAALHKAGFTDPGRAPNYWKAYPIRTADDTAMARELLGVLHDVYGYTGAPRLRFKTEKDPEEAQSDDP